MSQLADLIKAAGERGWLGWPQFGWVRPQFDVPSDGVLQRVDFGEAIYWRQDNAWTVPVEITREEHAELAGSVEVSGSTEGASE